MQTAVHVAFAILVVNCDETYRLTEIDYCEEACVVVDSALP